MGCSNWPSLRPDVATRSQPPHALALRGPATPGAVRRATARLARAGRMHATRQDPGQAAAAT